MITTKPVCDSCGAPSAHLYPYWSAALCDACAAQRVANQKAAEATEGASAVDTADEPSEAIESPQEPAADRSAATEARARKRARQAARRQALRDKAGQWTSEHNDQFPLQLGLCGRLVKQGDVYAARNLAITSLMGWVHARYWRLKGTAPSMPFDAVLALLRTQGDLSSDQFCMLVDAWRLLSAPVDQANVDSHTNAVGNATSQLMRVILDWPRLDPKEVRKAKKRASRRAGDALQAFHDDRNNPFMELEIGWPEPVAEDESAAVTEEAVPA